MGIFRRAPGTGPAPSPVLDPTIPQLSPEHAGFEHQLNRAVEARLNRYLLDPTIAAMSVPDRNAEILRRSTAWIDGTAVDPLDSSDPDVDPEAGVPAANPQVGGLRQRYARSVANRTDSVLGFRSRRRLEDSTWRYSVEEGVRGAVSFSMLEASARGRHATAVDAAQEARDMSLLSYVRADENETFRHRGRDVQIVGEGARLSQSIAEQRLARVDRLTAGRRGRVGAAFDRLALRYGNMSRKKKIAVGIVAGVALSATAVATAGTILGPIAGGVAAGLASGAKSTVTARLENRHHVLHAHADVRRTADRVDARHADGGAADGEAIGVSEIVAAFNTSANRKIRGNRFKAAIAAVGTLVAMHEVALQAPVIDVAVDKFGHVVRHLWDTPIGGAHKHIAGAAAKAAKGGSKPAASGAASHPFQTLNAKQTGNLTKEWAQGTNSYHDMQVVDTSHGPEFVMHGMQEGQTIMNGHVVNGVPHGAEVLITENTPTGQQIIEVPLNHALSGHLAEVVKDHAYAKAEIATLNGNHEDVYATSLGSGKEVSQGLFSTMTHDNAVHAATAATKHGAEAASNQANVVPSHEQIQEIAKAKAELYSKFAQNVHGEDGVSTQQLFDQAFSKLVAEHKLEVLSSGHGNYSVLESVAHTGGVEYQPATDAQVYRMLLAQLESSANKDSYQLIA